MAYVFAPQEGMTKEQSEALRELNSFQLMSDSDAWKKFKQKLQELVDEAREELIGCPATTSMEARSILSIRWQQREAMYRELMTFVGEAIAARESLLNELKEQNGDSTSDTGSNAQ